MNQEFARLFATQRAFTSHIRNPEHVPVPDGIEDRRMKIYRDLFYNNIESFIRNGFPVLRKISSDEAWHARVRDFFVRYQCQTPYFSEISREFVEFLQTVRGEHPDDPPFIAELAHYEWIELALTVDDDDSHLKNLDRNGNLLSGVPVVSPAAIALSYQFPVHRIGPDFQPDKAPESPTFLVVYRDRKQKVRFMEVNAVTYRLVELLSDNDAQKSGEQVLYQIAEELGHKDKSRIVEAGQPILSQLREREIISGTLNL